MDEKLSDMSFSLNFKEIIGSIDEKSEMDKMRVELQQKDEYIQELLKRIDELDGKVNNSDKYKSSGSSGGANNSGMINKSNLSLANEKNSSGSSGKNYSKNLKRKINAGEVLSNININQSNNK